MKKPIFHAGKTLFPSQDKFFGQLTAGEIFKTRSSPVIYLAVEGGAAVVHNENENDLKWFPERFPVLTLKAF